MIYGTDFGRKCSTFQTQHFGRMLKTSMETLNIFVRFQFVDDNKYGTLIKRTELGTTYTIHVPTMYYHL